MRDILQLIKSRRSIKFFKRDPISKNILNSILEAGIWAPSAHNFQPWHFAVIKNKKIKKQIISVINKKAKKLYAGFNIVLKDSSISIETAPILLLGYNNRKLSKRFSKFGKVYEKHMYNYEIESLAAAIQNIILMAYDRGIGSRWLGVLTFCEKEINKILKSKDNLIAGLALGKMRIVPRPPKRRTLEEVVTILE